VRLELPSPSNPGEGLALVKEQLARIPNRGIGYMALRYLGRDEALRQRLRRLPQPAVAFNYLGRLDPSGVDSVESILHKDTGGVDRSPEAERAHLIEIDCGLVSGRFHVCWSFSEAIHRRATIEGLAQSFVRALRDIVAHSETPAAGRYTPADFSKARVSQRDLDTVLSSLSKAGERRR
jgi:non-ribosomal peptide synthase protein (TIGR01720 family)